MLIVLFVVALLVAVGCFILNEWVCDDNPFVTLFMIISVIGAIACIISACALGGELQTIKTIDDKISICEEENAKVEDFLRVRIEEYKDWEVNAYKNYTLDELVAVVDLYPDLKSEALVETQIDNYFKNREEIKNYRIDKTMERVYRWWLYFGGSD